MDSLSGDVTSTSNKGRNKRQPGWMKDYMSGKGLFIEKNEVHLVMSTTEHPIHFEEAIKSEKGRKEMDLEMEAIDK